MRAPVKESPSRRPANSFVQLQKAKSPAESGQLAGRCRARDDAGMRAYGRSLLAPRSTTPSRARSLKIIAAANTAASR